MRPDLVESGMRAFTETTLKKAQHDRLINQSWWFNFGLITTLILLFVGLLLYKYKGKKTKYEIEKEKREGAHYIMSTLQNLAAIKTQEQGGSITGLPTWESNPEIDFFKRKINQ